MNKVNSKEEMELINKLIEMESVLKEKNLFSLMEYYGGLNKITYYDIIQISDLFEVPESLVQVKIKLLKEKNREEVRCSSMSEEKRNINIFNNINSKEELDNIIDYYNNEKTDNEELNYSELIMATVLPKIEVLEYIKEKGGIDIALEFSNILDMSKVFNVPELMCYVRLKTIEHELKNEKSKVRVR